MHRAYSSIERLAVAVAVALRMIDIILFIILFAFSFVYAFIFPSFLFTQDNNVFYPFFLLEISFKFICIFSILFYFVTTLRCIRLDSDCNGVFKSEYSRGRYYTAHCWRFYWVARLIVLIWAIELLLIPFPRPSHMNIYILCILRCLFTHALRSHMFMLNFCSSGGK